MSQSIGKNDFCTHTGLSEKWYVFEGVRDNYSAQKGGSFESDESMFLMISDIAFLVLI